MFCYHHHHHHHHHQFCYSPVSFIRVIIVIIVSLIIVIIIRIIVSRVILPVLFYNELYLFIYNIGLFCMILHQFILPRPRKPSVVCFGHFATSPYLSSLERGRFRGKKPTVIGIIYLWQAMGISGTFADYKCSKKTHCLVFPQKCQSHKIMGHWPNGAEDYGQLQLSRQVILLYIYIYSIYIYIHSIYIYIISHYLTLFYIACHYLAL